MTKNITLAVDEVVLRKVRQLASKRDTTVNALVRKHLEALSKEAEDEQRQYRSALDDLKEMSRNSGIRLGKGYAFTREDAYEGRLR